MTLPGWSPGAGPPAGRRWPAGLGPGAPRPVGAVGSRVRHGLAVAVGIAALVAPSAWLVAGLIAGAALFVAGPALRRLAAGRGRVDHAGLVLGADTAGRPVTLSDDQLAAHTLVVGASGAGKSTTMLTILAARIRAGRPVVALDMKGSPAFAETLRRAAASAGRNLRVWTLDGPEQWNPLAYGNATVLKDMLISTERFTEPHYRRAAERYVQTAADVLLAVHPGRAVTLDEIVAAMEPRRLTAMLRGVSSPLSDRVQDYVSGLTRDQVSAIRGLQTRLAVVTESAAGPYLGRGAPTGGPPIDLAAGLEGGDVILLSLNSSVYPALAAQIGALAVQGLVSAAGRRLDPRAGAAEASLGPSSGRSHAGPATVAIDEFSALGADNLLALLARGRESAIPVLFATQEMVDLERAGHGFRDQVLGIVGAKIIHRQDVFASAEMVARMAGTHLVWDETEAIRGLLSGGRGNLGSRRRVEAYRVHPNEVMELAPGQAVMLTKLPVARIDRVSVAPPRLPAPGTDRPRSTAAGADRSTVDEAATAPPPAHEAAQPQPAHEAAPPPPAKGVVMQPSSAAPGVQPRHRKPRRPPRRDGPARG